MDTNFVLKVLNYNQSRNLRKNFEKKNFERIFFENFAIFNNDVKGLSWEGKSPVSGQSGH